MEPFLDSAMQDRGTAVQTVVFSDADEPRFSFAHFRQGTGAFVQNAVTERADDALRRCRPDAPPSDSAAPPARNAGSAADLQFFLFRANLLEVRQPTVGVVVLAAPDR